MLLAYRTGTKATLEIELDQVGSKEEFIKYIKLTAMKILGILIPIIIVFVYLAINGAIGDFWDYCIAGVKTFTNKIPYSMLMNNDKLYIVCNNTNNTCYNFFVFCN